MGSTKSVFDLTLNIIDTRNPSKDELELCEKAFIFWKKSWEQTFTDLTSAHQKMFSDDFLDRQMTCLSFKGEPIALFFNNWFDLSRPSILEHSYFKNYPENVKEFFRKELNKETMVLTLMTVHPEWRSRFSDVPLHDLLFSISITLFIESNANNLIGYIRTDKSFHESFYRHGARKLGEGIAYNVPVDYCYLLKEDAHLSELPGVLEATEYLWTEMKQRNVYELAKKIRRKSA